VIRAKHAAQVQVKSDSGNALATFAGNAAITAGKRKAEEDTSIQDPHDSKRPRTDDDAASFADEPEFIPLTFAESDDDDEQEEDAEEDGTEELSISIDEDSDEDSDEEEDDDGFTVE